MLHGVVNPNRLHPTYITSRVLREDTPFVLVSNKEEKKKMKYSKKKWRRRLCCTNGASSSRIRPIKTATTPLVLLFLLCLISTVWSQVPGEVYTESGYDNVNGTDPICWSAPSFQNSSGNNNNTNNTLGNTRFLDGTLVDLNGVNWHSDLEPSFVAGPTTMQSSCWPGTAVFLDILPLELFGSDRLRTHRYYTYHVVARVDLKQLRKTFELEPTSFFYSSDGLHDVGFRIEFCPVNGNLCSPFILGRHDELDSHVYDEDGEDNDNDKDQQRKIYVDKENNGVISKEQENRKRRRRLKLLRSTVNDGEEYNEQHGLSQYHDGLHYAEERPRLQHLASEFFLIPVNITNETEFEFHLDVNVKVSVPGNYLPLAAFEFFLSNSTSEAAIKLDVANLLTQRSVTYYELPNIQSVSLAMEIVSYVIVAIAGLALVMFLGCTWYYRQHSVMKLSQCEFLMLLQFAGLFATCCSVLHNPKTDVYCHLQNPMTMIPTQFMLAIVFGRLRRILVIMRPLMNWNSSRQQNNKRNFKVWKHALMNRNSSITRESRDGLSSSLGRNSSEFSGDGDPHETASTPAAEPPRFVQTLQRWKQKISFKRRKSLRLQFTVGQLWIILILITLPIVILEIFGLIFFAPELLVDMNAEGSVGRYECGTDREQIYYMASSGVLGITLFATLWEAQKSRSLPGLFNEAASVSISLISSLFVACLGFAVILVSNDPAASPDVPYIMKVIVITFITTSIAARLTIPKLKLVWKGEQVVVSRMLQDHREKTERSRNKTETNSSVLVSGISDSVTKKSNEFINIAQNHDRPSEQEETNDSSSFSAPAVAAVSEAEDATAAAVGKSEKRPSVTFEESAMMDEKKERLQKAGSVVLIHENRAPPDRLAMRVMSHSTVMTNVNERILSGLCVNRSDWEKVQHSLQQLDRLLENAEYC